MDSSIRFSASSDGSPGRDHLADEGASRTPMLELSNAMVRLYKDVFGRGPTKSRASFAGPDTLVVVLENSMTAAERNLAALGEHGRVRDTRMFFQYAVEHDFRGTVERILGRRTVAFVSGIDTREDVAVEVFMLEPRAGDPAHPARALDADA
jgi:uncharacterized protein YbcI